MKWFRNLFALAVCLAFASPVVAADKIKALIVDGQNNHKWQATTPLLKQILETSGKFTVDVATCPADTTGFEPKFGDYQVIVSNYNGKRWPKATETALVEFVKNAGGFVSVHAANNSFPDWAEYNEMIAVGGWGGRNEKSGPYIRFKDGKMVLDESKGNGGSHGRQHEFVVETRAADHPIMKGVPTKWLHCQDELYDRLRGPAKNVTVLATAYADKATGGSGENEPMLLAVSYGKGRIFHTTLGHDVPAIKCVGFALTFSRGAEWAATDKVTQSIPETFPTADKTSKW